MKVLLDSGPLVSGDSVRGIGVYTRELDRALRLLDHGGIDFETRSATEKDLSKYDLVHFTKFNPFNISLPSSKPIKTKFVITIYDLIPLIYPKHYPPGIQGWLNWRKNKSLIRKLVDAIITISETSKKDICRFLGVDPNIVFVTYLAPRSIFKKINAESSKTEIMGRYKIPDYFALYVGDVNYNKNIPNLVKACKIARIPLVIVGKQAAEIETMNLRHPELKHLKKIDWSGVFRPGFVPDEDLVKIYNMAECFIQPSLYEGFGLPVLEAVVCGTPVVAAKTQALVEILGDDLTYVDPNNPKAMAKSILNPNKNIELSRDYSWDKTSEETLRVYKSLVI